jgi:hypothetical protein
MGEAELGLSGIVCRLDQRWANATDNLSGMAV